MSFGGVQWTRFETRPIEGWAQRYGSMASGFQKVRTDWVFPSLYAVRSVA